MKKKPAMIGAYFSYICILITTILFSIVYLQNFFYLLVVLEIFIPFFSYSLSKYCFNKLQPELYIFPTATLKNQNAKLFLKIHNNTRVPLASFGIRLSVTSNFYREIEDNTHFFALRANSENELNFPIVFSKCGLYEASISEMEGYDYLHLFHFKREINQSTRINIYPISEASEEEHEVIYSEGFDEFEESNKSGNVSSNVTDIREYQPGDRLQKIHWKLSEKIDKLMVKENEATSTNEFLILLELCQLPYSYDIENTKKKRGLFHWIFATENSSSEEYQPEVNLMLDHAIENAWSLGLEFLNANEIFVFAFYSIALEDFVMSTIRCEEDLEKAFSECYYHPSYDTLNLALSICEKTGMNKGTILQVTHEGVKDVSNH